MFAAHDVDAAPAQSILVAPIMNPVAAPSPTAPAQRYSEVVFLGAATTFIPYAHDVPLMLRAGRRVRRLHELWARAGYIPVGDDRSYGFGGGGSRAARRPG